MVDAVAEARALLVRRRTELHGELTRVNRAIEALGSADAGGTPDAAPSAVPSAASSTAAQALLPEPNAHRGQEPGALEPEELRRRILTRLESERGPWSPGTMAARLKEEGVSPSTDLKKSVRRAFWQLRRDGMAVGQGTGRAMQTYATKWAEQVSGGSPAGSAPTSLADFARSDPEEGDPVK